MLLASETAKRGNLGGERCHLPENTGSFRQAFWRKWIVGGKSFGRRTAIRAEKSTWKIVTAFPSRIFGWISKMPITKTSILQDIQQRRISKCWNRLSAPLLDRTIWCWIVLLDPE